MKTVFTFVVILFGIKGFCQAPEIEWQNTIGGTGVEVIHSIKQTSDGGFVAGGTSTSGISVDKSELCFGLTDYWVIKLSIYGTIEWQKTIGGNAKDELTTVLETTDGGFLIGGYSESPISGNKTESSLVGGFFGYDYWVVKLNSIGEIEWQNTIGGTNEDYLESVIQSSDGGFLLGGHSYSIISGEKTETCFGSNDYWVVKLNSIGNIEWQNTIGGTFYDHLNSVIQIEDGSYVLAGYSNSNISFDKTENCLGHFDYWVVKINSTGSIVWQNTIGGSGYDQLYSIDNTIDGGFILGGFSGSGISFDKTETGEGSYDFWVVKLNSLGAIEWQNTIGGASSDYSYSITQTLDGGYLIGGPSESNISGDKSQNSFGGNDYWLIKLNSIGIIEWEKTIGGLQDDFLNCVVQTLDNGFLLGGYSFSSISGEKTEISIGSCDYWILKLFPDCTPTPELCNSLDDNCNGLIDDAITETISISAGGPITFCQGGNVLLTATYSGATVQWKKNGTNIPGATSPTYLVNSKGTYTCETTSPCDTELSTGIFVNVQKNPPASITAGGATTFCEGGSVVLTANIGGGLSYQWYKGASLIAGATSINYTATIAGNYKCRVTKTATGCFKNSNVISVSVPCKEGELLNDENAFTIYPNPNDGTFTIEANVMTQDFASSESTIEIYNNLGQLIFSKDIIANDGIINETIELKNIVPGIYLIKLWSNNIQNVRNILIE